jgi:hypothetical protein
MRSKINFSVFSLFFLPVWMLMDWTYLCFRAIRKWEPYGGRLILAGRTFYQKGKTYIIFSWSR